MRNHTRRLHALEQQILAVPIALDTVRAAFVTLQANGDLPDDQRLADEVLLCAKTGLVASPWGLDKAAAIRAYVEAPSRPEDPLMDALYEEAVWAPEPLRGAARQVLHGFAAAGFDPTQPLFVGKDLAVPEYGGVGMYLLGFPALLVKPPYEAQAERLLQRLDELRPSLPQGNRRWFKGLQDAAQRFQQHGERPDDDLVLAAVLLLGELNALLRHAGGEDVADEMAAFDAVARAPTNRRAEALRRLGELQAQNHEANRDARA